MKQLHGEEDESLGVVTSKGGSAFLAGCGPSWGDGVMVVVVVVVISVVCGDVKGGASRCQALYRTAVF
jgi:hypothetical protein